MAEATQIPPQATPKSTVDLHYTVAMPHPETHLFEVTLRVSGWQSEVLDFKLPVWTPGSYLVREYARHVQDFAAKGDQPLPWRKVNKHHWQLETPDCDQLQISYRVYANELTVRTNHMDDTHAYFNGAALLGYVEGLQAQPSQVTIVSPRSDWRIATALPAVADADHTFAAVDYDTLVDSPFEIGRHRCYGFTVLGKPHELVIWGDGNAAPEAIVRDTQKIIAAEAALFGGLPYDQYLFLLHLSASGYGGLEHKSSCTLNYPRFGFRAPDKYTRFLQLVAHEFFHLWNVKRIRPKALEQFDYEGENYTPSLWFCEGVTSYYDLLIPFRAGLYDAKDYLKELSKEISRYLSLPGRWVQPLRESSFDAWIKLYRPDANSPNSQISYYLKGEMVTLLLDLMIRDRSDNRRSMDDVLQQLWQQFGQDEVGYTPAQLQQILEGVAGRDLAEFYANYLDGTVDLPFDDYLAPFGLCLAPVVEDGASPFWGGSLKSDKGKAVIKWVETGSPAQQAGLDSGDELVAIADYRVTAETLADRLRDYSPGDVISVSAFHQDKLRHYRLTLAAPRPSRYQLQPISRPSAQQSRRFQGWLGAALKDLT